MDTKQLKQKILDLAIRGKLVPQDPNDEPASVLLERIRKEKAQLIVTGKLKKSKSKTSDTPHYENVPFEIPASWEWVELDDYVKVVTDGDHQPPPQVPKGVPFLVISDVNTGKINFDKARFVSEHYYYELDENRKAQYNDILFTVTGSYGIPVLVDTNRVFCFQRHIGLIKTIDDPSWLYYVLQSLYVGGICDKVATGTAQKTVSLGNLREMFIPVPPSNEQKRIVAEIEKWFSLIDEIEQNNVDLLKAIKAAKSKILSLAISGKLVPQDPNDEPAIELLKRINPHFVPCDTSHYENLPFEIPQNWVWVQLGLVAKVIHGRNQSAVANPNGKYPIYGSGGIMGYADDYLCPEHCTIVGRKGTINNPILVETKFWNVDTAFGLQPNDAIDYLYFHYFCKGFDFTKLDKSTTLPSLTKTSLEQIDIPLPPLEEQARIVQKIKDIFAQLDKITAEL